MACASKFELERLYRACFGWLEVNLQPEDAIKVLDDCMTYGEVLGNIAKHNIEKAAWDIIVSDGYEAEWVKNVLRGNSLVCSEESMFNAVARWACEQANRKFPEQKTVYPTDWRIIIDDEKCSSSKIESKKEVVKNMKNMIQWIRFPRMSAEFIAINGLIATVLQPLEIINILRYQHHAEYSNTKFPTVPRYQIVEISQTGCCAQSSEHFATLDYDPKLLKFDTGEGDYPSRISGNMLGKVLGAELALTRCVSDNDVVIEGPAGLDVAQTKLDFQ